MKEIVVVGGGAAGMMAAIHAADSCKVTLIERNEKLGKKVFITGKGRCNVTNVKDTNDFFDEVVSNPKFLYSAIYGYDSSMVMDLFEKNGCPLKIERGGRVFPESDHSSDIIKTLETVLRRKDVIIKKNSKVSELLISQNRCIGVKTDKGDIHADAVILATGGVSYPVTGSDGNLNDVIAACGHNITELRPGLVPFEIVEEDCMSLQGLSLKNVGLTLMADGKKVYSDLGEMLFTHFGISGPLVLTASSIYSKKYYKKNCTAVIDLKPALDSDKLDKRILRDFDERKNKQFCNALDGLLPGRMIDMIVLRSGINPRKPVNEVTKEERLTLVNILKNLEFTIKGTREFKEAIITVGGVSVKDINPSTMESKHVSGLYFAGEMIDVDAFTGGYNLQIAWSTGKLAGESAAM